MNEQDFIKTILENDSIKYHPDIIFLKRRMIYLFKTEQYEKMSKIKKWIDELIKLHHK